MSVERKQARSRGEQPLPLPPWDVEKGLQYRNTGLTPAEEIVVRMRYGLGLKPGQKLSFQDEELAENGSLELGAAVRRCEGDVVKTLKGTGMLAKEDDGTLRRSRPDEMN